MKFACIAGILPTLTLGVTIEQENNALALISDLWNYAEGNLKLTPNAVRFGFHSCFGLGCNGCIDFNNGANAGLQNLYGILNEKYDQLKETGVPKNDKVMSRADFWALASWNAMLQTLPYDRSATETVFEPIIDEILQKYKYQYGRVDCSTSPEADYPLIPFPDERRGVDEIRRCFGLRSIFGFTDQELVALIGGGHSLGEGHLDASGFEGPWDDTAETLDENYVREMHIYEWEQKKNPKGHWQYYRKDFEPLNVSSLQLNTDYALVKELTLVDPSQQSDGKVTEECLVINKDNTPGNDNCPTSEFGFWGQFYSENGPALVRDFARVYDRMLKSTTEGKILTDAGSDVSDSSVLHGFSSFTLIFSILYLLF